MDNLYRFLNDEANQPGYIITNKGNLENGVIALNNVLEAQENCRFIRSADSIPVNYSPDEIVAYGFTKGKRYHSLQPSGLPKPTFIRFLFVSPHHWEFFLKLD